MTIDLKWGSVVQENSQGMGTSFFASFCYNHSYHSMSIPPRGLVTPYPICFFCEQWNLALVFLYCTPPLPLPPTYFKLQTRRHELLLSVRHHLATQASTTVPSWSHLHRRTPGRNQEWWGRWRCFLPSPVHRLPIRSLTSLPVRWAARRQRWRCL